MRDLRAKPRDERPAIGLISNIWSLLDLFEKTKRAGASEPDTWRLIANVLLNLDETITKE